jgi:hypothetical protein
MVGPGLGPLYLRGQREQQVGPLAWIGGHFWVPYEQNTQQSPDFGRSITPHPRHS